MRIVHLSDFHITSSGIKDTAGFIVKALIEDLKQYNSKKIIDCIFFTGDLIDKGGTSFKSIDDGFVQFEEFVVMPLLNALGLNKKQFIFVPGNHDISRNADNIHIETGLRSTLNDVPSVSTFIDKNDLEGIKRIIPFKNFERSFHRDTESEITNFQSSYCLSLKGRHVGVSAFNTAWRCYDSENDFRNILLGIRQVAEASKKIEHCELKIALLHHQLDYLKPFDMDLVQPYIHREYDLVLCGHVHKGSNYSQTSIYGDVLISVAPSNISENIWNNDQRYLNGYSIIDYDFIDKIYTVHNRKYSQTNAKYIDNTELGPDNNGVVVYQKEQMKSFQPSYTVKKKTEIEVVEFDSLKINTNDTRISDIGNQNYSSSYATKYVQIKNDQSKCCFYKSLKLIKKYANTIFSQSSEYYKLVNEIEFSVIMMDRLLLLNDSEKTKMINKIFDFHEIIESLETEKDSKQVQLIKLFDLVEEWLANIFKNVVSDSTNIDKIYDYMISRVTTADDFVTILLNSAKNTFNNIKQKQLNRLALKSDFGLISEIIISLIFPVSINLEYYKSLCIGLKTSALGPTDITNLIESINNEYKVSLLTAKGREKEVAAIAESVIDTKFTIIRGLRGAGKSTAISMFLKSLQEHHSSNILLFSFKHSTNITDFVRTIVEQCNTLIVNKLDTEALHEYISDSYNTLQHSDEKFSLSRYEVYKLYVLEAVKRVIEECGITYIILDSFELIGQQGNGIFGLLSDFPLECRLIITAVEETEFSWILEEKTIIEIHDFSRSEMYLFSNLNDDNDNNKSLNDKLFKKTNGQVVKINKFFNMIENDQKIDYQLLESFDGSDSGLFEEELKSHIDNQLLEEILLLLAIFEPIQPLSLEYIQRFLHYKEMNFRLPKIKGELSKLRNELSDIRFNRIKLINSDFATFLNKKHFSRKDIEDFIRLVFSWLSSDLHLRLDFICDFIQRIKIELGAQVYNDLIQSFINKLEEANDSNRLFRIGYSLFNDNGDNVSLAMKFLEKAQEMRDTNVYSFLGYVYLSGEKVDMDIGKSVELLKSGIDIGDAKSKGMFSGLLLDGVHVQKNIQEGQRLLEESVEQGNKTAKVDLAVRLLTGRGFRKDLSRANSLFDELVQEENVDGLRIMGNRYLYGQGLKHDVLEGRRLLMLAIKKGSDSAKLSLARYLIAVSENEQTEGIRYIEELISENHHNAKKYYSFLLLNGKRINKDIDRGLTLLLDLVNAGVEEAILEYAEILLDGNLVPQDVNKGKQLVEQLVNKKHAESCGFLGDLLIDGQYYNKNTERGIELLEEAATLGDVDSIRKLAFRHGYGKGIPKNMSECRRLFLNAIEKGDIHANYQLARVILESNTKDKEDIDYAISLLIEAEELGSIRARTYLGTLFIDGDTIEAQVTKGMTFLNLSIVMGDSQAMRELGYRLINGEHIPKDSYKGEELLKQAIDYGDTLAKTTLGHFIILGESYTKDPYEGVGLLEEALVEETIASRILGDLLIRGAFIKRDKTRGEKLLRDAVENGDSRAALNLSNMLIEGLFLNKNVTEGIKILQKLVDEENESAVIDFSEYLIKGDAVNKDLNKGIRLLSELSVHNLDAKHIYGYYLITGDNGVPKDVKKGGNLLREAEKKGHEDARRLLAQFLVDEVIEQQEELEGIKLFEKAVSNKDFRAMSMLGNIYLEGVRVEKNVEKAIDLFEQSIRGKNHEAKIRYARLLLEGELIPKDSRKGIELLEEATKSGSMDARYELAKISIEGVDSYKDRQRGLSILDELVADGSLKAKAYIAQIRIYGSFNVERNVDLGVQLLDELVEVGHEPAIILYADFLIEGIYLTKDLYKGERLLKRLAQKGSIDANYNLAIRYINGDGLKKHISTGLHRLEKAVGLKSETAMLEYGIRLKKGMKVAKNEIKGKEYIEKALKNATAQELHLLGIVAYKLFDYELATQLLLDSIDAGLEGSGISLAYMLRRNEIKTNTRQLNIFNLLQKGLFNNDTTAIINLILSLVINEEGDEAWEYGDVVIQTLDDCSMSIDWWVEISISDDSEGHLVIGWLTKHGKIKDPMGYSYKERLSKVKSDYKVPTWLLEEDRNYMLHVK